MQIARPTVPQTAAICPLTCRDAASGVTLATYSPDQVADLARGRDGLSGVAPGVRVARSMEYDARERAVATLPLR